MILSLQTTKHRYMELKVFKFFTIKTFLNTTIVVVVVVDLLVVDVVVVFHKNVVMEFVCLFFELFILNLFSTPTQ